MSNRANLNDFIDGPPPAVEHVGSNRIIVNKFTGTGYVSKLRVLNKGDTVGIDTFGYDKKAFKAVICGYVKNEFGVGSYTCKTKGTVVYITRLFEIIDRKHKPKR